jgi:hypothetical protein
MQSDRFLIASYIVGGLVCLGIALAVNLWMRRSVEGVLDILRDPDRKQLLKRAFPSSIILIAVSAFLGVNYYGCPRRDYESIAADHAYILGINYDQIWSAALSLIVVIVIWAVIILVNVASLIRQRAKARPNP